MHSATLHHLFATATLLALMLWPSLSSASSLLQLYQAAKANDHQYLAARAQYLADAEQSRIARSDLLPSVTLSADTGKIDQEINRGSGSLFTQGRSRFNDRGYSISARQPLMDFNKWRQLKKARNDVSAAEARWQAARQSLIARLVNAWLNVLEAEDALTLAQANETAIARQLELAQSRLDADLAPITEVHETRARASMAKSERIQAEAALRNARSRLRAITGPTTDLPRPDPSAWQITNTGAEDDWLSKAEQHSPSLLEARAAVRAAEANWKAGKATHYPVLELVGEQSYRDSGGSVFGDGRESTRKTVKLELSMPLIQGGKTLYQNRRLAQQYLAAQEQLAAAHQNLKTDIADTWNALTSSADLLQALTLSVNAARLSLKAKTESFSAGLVTNIDVLNAENELLQARQKLNRARYQRIRDWIRLRQQVGVLAEDDLTQILRQDTQFTR